MRDPIRRETDEMKNHRSWEYETAGGTRDEAWAAGLWRLYIYTQPDGIWIDNDTRKMSWFDSRWRLGIESWVLFLCRWARCCYEVVTVGIFRTTKVSQRSPCVVQGSHSHQTSPCSSCHCVTVSAPSSEREIALVISLEYCIILFGNYSTG